MQLGAGADTGEYHREDPIKKYLPWKKLGATGFGGQDYTKILV